MNEAAGSIIAGAQGGLQETRAEEVQDPRSVAQEALALLPEFTSQMDEALADVVDMLRVRKEQEAMERFALLTQDLYWLDLVFTTLDSILGLDLDALAVSGSNALDHRARLITVLEEIMVSIESRDYILLADLLEYELREEIIFWQQMAPDLIMEANRPLH